MGAQSGRVWARSNGEALLLKIDSSTDNESSTVLSTIDYSCDLLDWATEIVQTVAGLAPAVTLDQQFDEAGNRTVLALDQTGAVTNRYLWGAAVDEILADEQVGGELLWTLTDNLGTVRELVNNTSAVRNHIVYDTYGNVLSETAGGARSAIKFTGRYFDTETGLQWNLNRWYDPKVGRWLSQDPIGFDGGDANLYRYVGNDPGNGVDPSGLMPPDSIMDRRLGINDGYYRSRDRMAEYNRAMDKYNRELFAYYQRLLEIILQVGEELWKNGMAGVARRFPWLDLTGCKCTEVPGCIAGPDGESSLYVRVSEQAQKSPFPVQWPRLAKAMRYSQRQYGDFDDWWLLDASSLNVHGIWFLGGGLFPWIFLSDEQFYGTEGQALVDMIHEPLHDFRMYGIGHGDELKEIVPADKNPAASPYGSDWEQMRDFFQSTRCGGKSLWQQLLDRAGPRPVKPPEP